MEKVSPSADLSKLSDGYKIFLGGGFGKPWREEALTVLNDLDIIVIDPTVPNWDAAVASENMDNPLFIQQVAWEHVGLQISNTNLFHFDETTLAPITLVELCLYKDMNSIIHLEDGYEKGAYVEYIAHLYDLRIIKELEELHPILSERLEIANIV